jgi:Uma2 family endonuclease
MPRVHDADLELAPPHRIAEIIDGELIVRRVPPPIESAAATALSAEIGVAYRFGRGKPGGWVLLNKPEVHLAEHVLVPDLAAWRQDRLMPLPETPYVKITPDWVCEVLSPETAGNDRGRKPWIYAEAGVGHLWLLDPRVRLLETFALADGKWKLLETFTDTDEVSAPPFDAVSFSLDVLWPFDQLGESTIEDKPEA